VADECKDLLDALHAAEKESANFEAWTKRMDKSADEWEAEAWQELGSIGECTGGTWSQPAGGGMRWLTWGEYLDEQCVIDKWIHAHELLQDARNAEEMADDYLEEWLRWDYEANERAEKYCKCANEKPG
jgi:DNA-binding transcriptional MocR family regulator